MIFFTLSVLFGCFVLFVILYLGMVGSSRVVFGVMVLSLMYVVILLSFDLFLSTIFEADRILL